MKNEQTDTQWHKQATRNKQTSQQTTANSYVIKIAPMGLM